MDVVIYHNPDCATSRNTLGLVRNAGLEPHVIEYLKTPPSRVMLAWLVARMGIAPRDLLREKGTPFHDLGLDDPALSDEALFDAMLAHPILINRPIVVSPMGVKLCPVRARSPFPIWEVSRGCRCATPTPRSASATARTSSSAPWMVALMHARPPTRVSTAPSLPLPLASEENISL